MKRSVKASTTSVDVQLAFSPDRQGFFCVFDDDVQRAVNPPVMGTVLNKVVGPNVVWPLCAKAHAGPIGQPKPTPLWLFLRDFQPFLSPDPLYHCPTVVCSQTTRGVLMIYGPAAVVQHARDHAIATSSELFFQLDDIPSQPFFIRQAIWHFSLRRTMLTECGADTALIYAKGLPHMIDTKTATGSG